MNDTIEINTEQVLKRLERPLKEGPSETGFRIGLYLEHLEEASFLYEQRISLLDDPELSWRDLEDFEERFEAHVDALVVGEGLALSTCLQQAIEGDFGELHATVRVLCRWNNFILFRFIIDNGDVKDKKRLKAIDDALCHEMPAEWIEHFYALCKEKESPALYSIIAHVAGYLRLKRTDIIYGLLDNSDDAAIISKCAWSLGRIGTHKDTERLTRLFTAHTDPEIREQAGLALLRLKDTSIVQRLFDIKESWAYILLGIAGTPQAQNSLIGSASGRSTRCPENILGIGLAGAVQGIDILVDALDNKELSEAASQALYCITGAELFEEVEMKEPEPEENENESNVMPLARPRTKVQLSQKSDVWREWLEKNKKDLSQNGSIFLGSERGNKEIIIGLQSEKPPKRIRKWLCEMAPMVLPNGWVIEFDWLTSNQITAMNNI
jgi:hypothetical protein